MNFKNYTINTIFTILFIFSSKSYSQTVTFSGIVKDSLGIPLEDANIIATPQDKKKQLKFSISDTKGKFILELEKSIKYEITASYIGFLDEIISIELKDDTNYDFILKSSNINLSEIILDYEYKPIDIKKDTLTYDIKSFVNGNEQKMKEVLEKLPGVEVDNYGNVTVNGKKVTKMLVEGKLFFEGGTKLAVENIPANALDKIEVIDNYNDITFMKHVSDNRDLAMNVKLKEDKKKFAFGDFQLGLGSKKTFLGHSNLFYFTKGRNFSFIGDSNNIGKSTFSIEDYFRFNGGVSNYVSNRKTLTNLFQFANSNKDVFSSKSQFSALNFNLDVSPKLNISGYTIFSKSLTINKSEVQTIYLQNSIGEQENKNSTRSDKNILGIVNLKLDYSPRNNEKIYYNNQFQINNNKTNNYLTSITNSDVNIFQSKNKFDNISIKQYFEWHKKINSKNTSTFVLNQVYDLSKPQNMWITNEQFLENYLPLQTDNFYTIEQVKKTENNAIDMQFIHYWSINNKKILYTNIGYSYTKSNLITSEKQILSNGIINDFSNNGFGNNINYSLNDLFLGIEYKLSLGKWINKPELYIHLYQLDINQNLSENNITKIQFEPKWESKYNFSNSESLTFNYKLSNVFPNVHKYVNFFTLENYNVIFKGNAILENERYHYIDFFYSKNNLLRRITMNSSLSLSKKNKNIQNETILNGIEQFNTPILTNNPETNINFHGTITKKIYRFNIYFNTNLDWYNFYQKTNTILTKNNINSQDLSFSIKTISKYWPVINVGYTKKFSQFKNDNTNHFKSDIFNCDLEITFLKNYIFKIDYENIKNTNPFGHANYFDIANTSVRYQKKNFPFLFELTFSNIFDNKIKNQNTFSSYIISNKNIFLLPRFCIFTASYKF